MKGANFIGRRVELEHLRNICREPVSHLLHLRGRRRIGKTVLLLKIAELEQGFYFSGIDDESNASCRLRFAKEWDRYAGVTSLGQLREGFLSWESIFQQVGFYAEAHSDRPFVLIFDEIQWLAKKGAGILGQIKRAWESEWSSLNNFKLIIAGSSSKFFLSHVDNTKGVLFGQRTVADMHLGGFSLTELRDSFFSDYSFTCEQICLIKMMTGGVPYYLNQILRSLVVEKGNFFRALNKTFFCSTSIFLDEIDNLFSLEFKAGVAISNVISIVRATGQDGATKANIVKKTGLPDSTVNGLVAKLVDYKILNETYSFRAKSNSRYRRFDPFIDFYFQLLEPMREQIMDNSRDGMLFNGDVVATNKGFYIPNFSGKAFELLLFNFFKNKEQVNAPIYDSLSLREKRYEVGAYWVDKVTQIDLIVESSEDRESRIIEAKWLNQRVDISTSYVDQLKNKKYCSPDGYKQSRFLLCSGGYSKDFSLSLPDNIKILHLEELF